MTAKKKMTRTEEYEFYAKPENQEPQGRPVGAGRSSPSSCRFAFYPRHSRRSAGGQERMTGQFRAGSGGRSSTNCGLVRAEQSISNICSTHKGEPRIRAARRYAAPGR